MEIVIRHAEPDDYVAMHRVFEGRHVVAGMLQLPYQSAERWRSRMTNPAAVLRERMSKRMFCYGC